MKIEEAIQRLSIGDLKCEICERPLTKSNGFTLDTQGNATKVICTNCHDVRVHLEAEGLDLP